MDEGDKKTKKYTRLTSFGNLWLILFERMTKVKHFCSLSAQQTTKTTTLIFNSATQPSILRQPTFTDDHWSQKKNVLFKRGDEEKTNYLKNEPYINHPKLKCVCAPSQILFGFIFEFLSCHTCLAQWTLTCKLGWYNCLLPLLSFLNSLFIFRHFINITAAGLFISYLKATITIYSILHSSFCFHSVVVSALCRTSSTNAEQAQTVLSIRASAIVKDVCSLMTF